MNYIEKVVELRLEIGILNKKKI